MIFNINLYELYKFIIILITLLSIYYVKNSNINKKFIYLVDL